MPGIAHLFVDMLFEHVQVLEVPVMDILSLKISGQCTDREWFHSHSHGSQSTWRTSKEQPIK